MKIPDSLNEDLKDAVAAVRKFGEPIEVFWQSETDEPWDQDRHGNWQGDLASMKDLRRWIEKHGLDGRTVTIYCRGDDCEVVLVEPGIR